MNSDEWVWGESGEVEAPGPKPPEKFEIGEATWDVTSNTEPAHVSNQVDYDEMFKTPLQRKAELKELQTEIAAVKEKLRILGAASLVGKCSQNDEDLCDRPVDDFYTAAARINMWREAYVSNPYKSRSI